MAADHLPVPMDDQLQQVRRAAEHEAAECVAVYAMAQDTVDLTIVGTGTYGLIAVLSDGARRLKFVGFATSRHAEIFARYAECCLNAGEAQRAAAAPADSAAQPDPVDQGGGVDAPGAAAVPPRIMVYGKVYVLEGAAEAVAERPRILRYEIVAVVSVLDQRQSDNIARIFSLPADVPPHEIPGAAAS